eukprot:gene14156-16680_t
MLVSVSPLLNYSSSSLVMDVEPTSYDMAPDNALADLQYQQEEEEKQRELMMLSDLISSLSASPMIPSLPHSLISSPTLDLVGATGEQTVSTPRGTLHAAETANGKRRSFNGVDSNSIFNEIIDAFPTPPGSVVSSPVVVGRPMPAMGNGGATSSSTVTSPNKTPMSPATKADQRSFLIREIISTENDYINDLETVIQVFYRPLRDELKLITTEECASVFSNIEQLLEVNKELYDKMNSSMPIGEVFSLMNLQLTKRHLLNEGSIQMVEGYNENTEKKHSSLRFKKGSFFLFHDLFLFAKQKGSVYKLVASIPLDCVLVNSTVSSEIGVGGKRWTFFPQSKAHNQVLLLTIQKLIEKCWEGRYEKPATTNNASGKDSPNLQKKKLSHRLVKSLVNMKTL